MNLSQLFPPEIVQWLIRYGLFAALAFFALVGFALLMRPFWLWYSGRSETLDRLKLIDDTVRKALLELELLNQTLSIPVKRANQKAKGGSAETPMVVTQEAKEAFLKVLEKIRKTIQNNHDEPQSEG